jgi:hypothetical protein
MALTIGATSFTWPPNTIDDTIDSADSANSPAWRVSNLSAGTLVNLGTGTNMSDVGYNPFTKRFGFIRNNFGTIDEFSEADIVGSVATPTPIRLITVSGISGFEDSEGLSNVFPNLTEGGYEFWICIENGGRNWGYNVPISEAIMFGTTAATIPVRQRLQFAPNASDGNDGAEGIDMHLATQDLLLCREGAVDVRKIYNGTRPTDRDTDYDETDAEFTVAEPFDAEVVVPSGSDLSSCCFHPPTGHLLLLSDLDDVVYQYTTAGVLIDTLTITGMFQPEGICMHGDNMVIMGEIDECRYYTYVAP